MTCGTLGNNKDQECGRPRSFWVNQGSLASTIYTSSKYVIWTSNLNKEENIIAWENLFGLKLWCGRLMGIQSKGRGIIPFSIWIGWFYFEELGIKKYFIC